MDTIPHTSGIYQILCVPTGKVYVGSAVNLYSRRHDHFKALRAGKHSNRHLQNAWVKYGESSFTFTVLELVDGSDLIATEQQWIDALHACDREYGFNIRRIADSNRGTQWSEESRQRRSDDQRGKKRGPMSEANRAGISAARKGSSISEERKAHLREINLGKKHSEATRQKISASQMGRQFSDETRAKISAAQLGTPRKATRVAEWIVTTPDNTEIRVINLAEFCKQHELGYFSMLAVAHSRTKQHKGWRCRRIP